MLKKVCVVTGARADYGHLYWLIKEIQTDPELLLQIIVTGMHLSPEFGMTIQKIVEDGFPIDDKIEMLLSADSPTGVTKSIGLAVIGFADSLARLKPDLLVILGDRFEILAAAQSAMIAKIPVVHLHGGEATYGAYDESIRNAITKMSHIHFAAEAEYANRILQMGENPQYVFNFGGPGLDYIAKEKYMTRQEFEKTMSFKLGELNFLVTYHPVTLNFSKVGSGIEQLLQALDHFKDAKIIFTMPNADVDGRNIASKISEFVKKNTHRAVQYDALGQSRYYNAISHTDVVIGNSSSGLNEVPSFRKPTVNIGTRQDGRLYPASVIHCNENTISIINAIEQALSPEFKLKLASSKVNENIGNISRMIKDTIKKIDLDNILIKKFHNYSLPNLKQMEEEVHAVG